MAKTKSSKSNLSSKLKFNNFTALLAVALVALIGAGIVLATQAAAPSLSLEPGSTGVLKGSTLNIAVYENSYSTEVNAVQAVLSYDPSKLQFVSITSSGSPFTLTALEDARTPGIIRIAKAIPGSRLSGKQYVANVAFKNIVNTDTTSSVNFTSESQLVSYSSNANILVDKFGGNYTLKASSTPTK